MLISLALSAAALAATPEVVVVGVHVPGLVADAPADAAERLTKAVDATGKLDGLAPEEVSAVIAGREALILDTYALGPGRERLKEGTVLYERAQPEQAIPVLSDAVRSLENGLAVSTSSRDLQDALLTLGLAQVGLGEEGPARVTFRRAAVLDPERQLDTVRYSPDVVDLYETVRKDALASAPGILDVTASADATVFVDGKSLGAAPQKGVQLVPGEHFLLVRSAEGASYFQSVTLRSGETRPIDALLEQGGIGVAATDGPGRVRQTRDLYRAIGTHTGNTLVLLAGQLPDGQVGLQLYSPASGSFSRPVTGEAGGDPVGALLDLVPTVAGYVGDNGDIRADRVSPNALGLDVGTNSLLATMLYNPTQPTADGGDERRGPPWYLWAGLGAAVAGGGAAVAAVVLTGDEPTTEANDNGTIQFGPIP